MRFYTKQHKYYCGIDLHTKKMKICILNAEDQIRLHQNIKTDPKALCQSTALLRSKDLQRWRGWP